MLKLWNFNDHIWNHHKNYIEMSTNMPGIGSANREIAVQISETSESKHDFAQKNQCPRSKC